MAYDRAATEAYIRQAAKARGIDPDTAVRVAKSEGLAEGIYQSNLAKGGRREPSYGPFQLLVGGEGTNYPAGMGNDFIAQTGLDPRDPSTVNAQVDFALDNAAQNGWGAWYGAAKVGVGKRDGIGGNAAPQGSYSRDLNTGTSTMAGYPSTGLGGLGGLGGMMPEEETQGGIGGFLNSGNGGDLLQAIGMSLMSSPSNNPFAGVSETLPGMQARTERRQLIQQEQAKENRTLSYLRQQYPEIAQQVDAGLPISDAFRLAQAERLAQAKIEATGTEGPRRSLQPQYGIGPDGKPVIIQLGEDGVGYQTQMPEGVELAKEPIRLDGGTSWILLDPLTRQRVGEIPKDIAGAAGLEVTGKANAERDLGADAGLQDSENALAQIEDLRKDPNRERGTGSSSIFNRIPGTAGYDYQSKVKRATAGAFLTAIDKMRGLGAMSEAEGKAATAAVTSMDTATSEEEFMSALDEYEKIVRQGKAKAERIIAQRSGRQAPNTVPDQGAPAAAAGADDPLGLR